MKTEKALTEADLARFTNGSAVHRQHGLMRGLPYTEGVAYVAEKGDADWLIDRIASYQLFAPVEAEPLQRWTLTVDDTNRTARLVCDDGKGRRICEFEIASTDFPMPSITMWLVGGVLMLPGER